MKKSTGLIFIITLVMMANCNKPCPQCPPVQQPEVRIQEALDSTATDAAFKSKVTGMLSIQLQKKWAYRKLYRLCIGVTVKTGYKVQFVLHKKNNSEIVMGQVPTGQYIYFLTNRQLFSFNSYVAAQVIDAAGTVVQHIPLVYDPTVSFCPPTSGDRDKIKGTTTTGTTVTVTVDEM